MELLVEGSLAAARGDLDHRVPVRGPDEVGAVANAFNFMMEDLKTSKEKLVIAERIAAWQEIARRLAHEIKNPLTPIQMAMDTLRKSYKKQHPSSKRSSTNRRAPSSRRPTASSGSSPSSPTSHACRRRSCRASISTMRSARRSRCTRAPCR